VMEELPTGSPFKTAWVVNPLPIDPSLPPVSYFREYGETLERGDTRPSFATWYEDQRATGPAPERSAQLPGADGPNR
jgi:hypothetical protein